MSTLENWDDKFGHLKPFDRKDRRLFNMEYHQAYCCKIASAQLSVSSRGDKQLQLNLKVLDGDEEGAEEVGRAVEYFTLPKQDSDLRLDENMVKKIHERRFQDVIRILSAAEPETYSLYHWAEGEDKQRKFYDFNNKVMSKADFAHREKSIQADCQLWVDNAHDRIGEQLPELAEAQIYITKVKNPKSEKFPWTNLYANRPRGLPVYRASESVPF